MSDERSDRQGRELEELLASRAVWASPPADLEDKVTAAITEHHMGTATQPWWRRVVPLVAAAAAGAAIAVGAMTQVGSADSPQPDAAPLAATDLEPDATGSAIVVATPLGTRIGLDLADLSAAADGVVYHGWVTDDGHAVSAGTFHMRGGDGRVWLWIGVDAAQYDDFVVTREQVDSTATVPVDDIVVLRGRLRS